MNPFLNKWDRRFLQIANEVSQWSKDPGTKVGCVLVKDRRIVSTGYNGFPQNLSDDLSFYKDRDYKLAITVHAETNAILNAAKNGSRTEDCIAYVTFPPCSHCASALIQAGIAQVICPNPSKAPERWKKSFQLGNSLLFEAGIKVIYSDDQWKVKTAPSAEGTG